jgi:leader peptidase (prepilin peptidase)/N-methyltransferase
VPHWFLPLILAPFIGSFAGMLIRRLPIDRPAVPVRSCCDTCGHVLGLGEMLQLVGIVMLGGRCRCCGVRISGLHRTVELACLVIAVWSIAVGSDPLGVWMDCALGWTLLTLAWIDWKHMMLPDILTLPLVLAGLAATQLRDPGATAEHTVAATAGYLAFRAIEIGYWRLRARDGLGQGDAKLMAGAWLGLAPLPTVAFTASVAGLAIAAGLHLRGRPLNGASAIPLGPAMCGAIWAARFGVDTLMSRLVP